MIALCPLNPKPRLLLDYGLGEFGRIVEPLLGLGEFGRIVEPLFFEESASAA